MTKNQVLIAGKSIAGTAAAVALSEAGYNVALEEVNDGALRGLPFINPTPLNADVISGRQFSDLVERQLADRGVSIGFKYVEDYYYDSNADQFVFSTGFEEALTATWLIVASCGQSADFPQALKAEKFYGKGLSSCAWSDGYFFKNKAVVVLGATPHGLDQVHLLLENSITPTVVTDTHFFPSSAAMIAQLDELGVTCLQLDKIESIEGAEQGIQQVVGRRQGLQVSVPCDGVFSGLDLVPWRVQRSGHPREIVAGIEAGVPYYDHEALYRDGLRAAQHLQELDQASMT